MVLYERGEMNLPQKLRNLKFSERFELIYDLINFPVNFALPGKSLFLSQFTGGPHGVNPRP